MVHFCNRELRLADNQTSLDDHFQEVVLRGFFRNFGGMSQEQLAANLVPLIQKKFGYHFSRPQVVELLEALNPIEMIRENLGTPWTAADSAPELKEKKGLTKTKSKLAAVLDKGKEAKEEDTDDMATKPATTPTRHVLVLSTNASSWQLLFERGLVDHAKYVVIFGSEFSHDQTTLHLHNAITLIRRTMEIGGTVVLLHLEKLHESLYDMLNQVQQCTFPSAHSLFSAIHDVWQSLVLSNCDGRFEHVVCRASQLQVHRRGRQR